MCGNLPFSDEDDAVVGGGDVRGPSFIDAALEARLEAQLASMSVAELRQAVAEHNRRYHVEARPLISDGLFDRLLRRLGELAPSAPEVEEIAPFAESVSKIVHTVPMLSLDKAYDLGTIANWFAKFNGPALATPKVDGVACSVRYDASGNLAMAATRGDGSTGEEITDHVRQIPLIPPRISAGPLEVRGEVYIPLSVFRRFEAHFANPRNLAAGAIKHKDAARSAAYGLHFFAYDLLGEELSERQKLARLADLGFVTLECQVVHDVDEVEVYYRDLAARRMQLDYEVDGVVVRVDDRAQQLALGVTAHHPRYALAYKFQGDSGESVLEDVAWSVSRSGAINPVALVQPVLLSGAMVSRATLHNLAFMESLELSQGARLLLTRRGGVIPHVEALVAPGEVAIAVPTHCPSCGEETVRNGDVLYCSRPEACSAKEIAALKHFVDAIGCKGFGKKVIAKLFDGGLVREPADFFLLDQEALLSVDGVQRRGADNLLQALSGCKRLSLERFLAALAIARLGKVQSALLAGHFKRLAAVRAATVEEIAEIPGFGDTVAGAIVGGVRAMHGRIERLLDLVEVEEVSEEAGRSERGERLAGQRVLITGTLSGGMTRQEAEQKAREAGAVLARSVNAQLDILVVGEKPSATKTQKAEALRSTGVALEILDEEAFLRLIAPDAGE